MSRQLTPVSSVQLTRPSVAVGKLTQTAGREPIPWGLGDHMVSNNIGARTGPPARNVAAVVSGNALEFYDFLTYA